MYNSGGHNYEMQSMEAFKIEKKSEPRTPSLREKFFFAFLDELGHLFAYNLKTQAFILMWITQFMQVIRFRGLTPSTVLWSGHYVIHLSVCHQPGNSIHLASNLNMRNNLNLSNGDNLSLSSLRGQFESDAVCDIVIFLALWQIQRRSYRAEILLFVTIIDVHYSLYIQFSTKSIVFFMLMAQ